MGNDPSRRAFKGQGHTLSGERVNAPTSSKKGSDASTGSANLRSILGTSKAKATSKAVKKPVKTSEEIEEQRRKQEQAAEARGKAWDNKLAKQRAERAKARASQTSVDQGKGTASMSAEATLEGIDTSKLNANLDSQARKLESSGFDLYKSTVSSSTQARSALTLNEPENLNSDTMAVPPALYANPIVVSPDDLLSSILQATSECNKAELNSKIQQADAYLSREQNERLKTAVEEAKQLVQALELSAEDDSREASSEDGSSSQFSSEAVEKLSKAMDQIVAESTLEQEATLDTIRKLIKILDNIKNNPENQKFRRLRLSNSAIEKIVKFAGGAPMVLLNELGFAPVVGEGNDQFLYLGDEKMEGFLVRYSAVFSSLEHLLKQMETSVQ